MWAKQSTAATLIVGPILDSTGAEYNTSAVIGDLSISKNGSTLTALASAATLTFIANGFYTLVLRTTDVDTLGRLQISCNKATYQMPPVNLMVVPAMVFDSMVLGTDRFDTNVTHVADTSQTAGDLYASQVAIAGYIDTEVSAIKAKTDNLPSDPADQSAVEAAITAATSPLATQASVNTIDDFLDTEIAAIKTKTDQLTFTVANKVDSTAELDSAVGTQITAIETFATRMTTGLVVDGAVWQFTANMLELAPAGGGGGGGSGDATLAKQEEILTQLDVIQTKTDTIGSVGAITSLLAAAVLEPGTITSFPETLTIGDSYTEQNGREIQIPIIDTDGTPLSSTGSLNFADASVTFTLQRSGETDSTRVITGTATFVDPPGTGTGAGAPYAVIELPASETAKGLKKYKYSGILTFLWTGTGTDVMSFETDTVTFDS
jgi:hypothetical protein